MDIRMIGNSTCIVFDLVDYVMPDLTPYEGSLYLSLLRLFVLYDGSHTVRIDKRRVADRVGRSSMATAPISYAKVTDVFKSLEEKGCISVGDTIQEGTRYAFLIPRDIPFVEENHGWTHNKSMDATAYSGALFITLASKGGCSR
jgi:hypothetical protein